MHFQHPSSINSANGIRTRVWALRGPRPSPLDDSAKDSRFASPFTPYNHNEARNVATRFRLTGPAGLEPATPGFGDRCSTN